MGVDGCGDGGIMGVWYGGMCGSVWVCGCGYGGIVDVGMCML